MPPVPGLTIAEPAAHTGLSADTLRYYERGGLLLQPVGRSATGHQRYVLQQLAEVQEHLGAIDAKIGIYTDAVEHRLDLERAPGV